MNECRELFLQVFVSSLQTILDFVRRFKFLIKTKYMTITFSIKTKYMIN